jgi:hypothetical protein
MNSKYTFQYGSEAEIQKRASLVQNFLIQVINLGEQPIFVSDEATIFDISSDSEDVLLSRIFNSYRIKLSKKDLQLKVWQLIDLIHK